MELLYLHFLGCVQLSVSDCMLLLCDQRRTYHAPRILCSQLTVHASIAILSLEANPFWGTELSGYSLFSVHNHTNHTHTHIYR